MSLAHLRISFLGEDIFRVGFSIRKVFLSFKSHDFNLEVADILNLASEASHEFYKKPKIQSFCKKWLDVV